MTRFSCCNIFISVTLLITFLTIFLTFIDKRQSVIYRNLDLKSIRENKFILNSKSNLKNTVPNDEPIMSSSFNGLIWFIQISDLHLSKFHDNDRTQDLKAFCETDVKLLAPEAVLVSGDITDAKSWTAQSSMQYIEEWIKYQQTIQDSGILHHTKWLDVRGNHDCFNLPHLNSPDNFYKTHSVYGGKVTDGSFIYVARREFGNYSIVALDACPNPGPKRPYNFFGVADSRLMQAAERFGRTSRSHNGSIWFGHYPLSTVIPVDSSGGPEPLRRIIGRAATAYLCGHLHTLGGLVPNFYTLQPEGFLELELADWRDTRTFRLLTFDHDLLSFVEARAGSWPLVLVTNPKDSRYLLPAREPVHRIASSSHVRILAWSPNDILKVRVWLNGEELSGVSRSVSNQPLWTAPWSPELYTKTEGHELLVEVTDGAGRVNRLRQPFSSRGTPLWQFRFLPSFILLGDVARFMQSCYYSMWLLLLCPPILLRLARHRFADLRLLCGSLPFVQDLNLFVKRDVLFYSWIIYLLYEAAGPLVICEVIDGYIGFVFVYGIYVNGAFVPEAFVYHLECIQLVWFMLPLLVLLSRRCRSLPTSCALQADHWFRDGPFLVLLFMQLCFAVWWTYMPNGILALLLSPGRLWLLPWAIFMRRHATPDLSPTSVARSLKN